MPGRKLLYVLRRPLTAGYAGGLLPGGESSPSEDDISVVLLDAAVTDGRHFPGRTFILREDPAPPVTRPDTDVISYADLVKFIFEADSTIVL